jgi:integral membrane protein (TIGR00529 family)
MVVVAVAAAFGLVMFLASRDVSLWLALLVGTGVVGLLSPMGLPSFMSAFFGGLLSPLTIQLVAAVLLISGLGRVMKENGDLELAVSSLVSLVPRPKLLTMLLPAVIGTINVTGGAIMSAPMVEENGKALGLDRTSQAAVNLFFRHIAYFVYPLHTSLIILSEVLAIPKQSIILSNVLPTLAGTVAAYWLYFRRVDHSPAGQVEERDTLFHLKKFLLGFSPVLVILALVLFFDVPFYLAIAAGLALALVRNIQAGNKGSALANRLKELFRGWINYKLGLTILSLMLFKSVVEASGVTNRLAELLLRYGIPLPILVISLSLLISYILGTHMAAAGLLAPLFAPLFPPAALIPYTALFFVCIMLGYLVSPLHLCLVLTNQYFEVPYEKVLRKLAQPMLAMLVAVVLQLLFFL